MKVGGNGTLGMESVREGDSERGEDDPNEQSNRQPYQRQQPGLGVIDFMVHLCSGSSCPCLGSFFDEVRRAGAA